MLCHFRFQKNGIEIETEEDAHADFRFDMKMALRHFLSLSLALTCITRSSKTPWENSQIN